jgi:glycosyltransferase involved in cell wall biosynthesis
VVTVVICTKDRRKLFRRSFDAINAQDYAGPLECIVVFDGEPYDDELGGDDPRRTVRTIRNTRSPGLAGARNSGIDVASGELLAFCDDDDVWYPGKLTAQVELFRRHPDASVIGCDIEVDHDGTRTRRSVPMAVVRQEDLLRNRIMEIHPSTVLCRLATVREHAVWVDELLPGGYGEDHDWLIRMAGTGPIRAVPQVLVTVYWHPSSFFTGRWATIADACEYMLAKHAALRADARGTAHFEGKRAFALAASGRRREATKTAMRALRRNPAERRAWATLVATSGIASPERIQRWVQARGRGI